MIFKNECKRIVRPIILVFLVVVSVLWYLAFMKSCNMYLDNDMGMPYAVAKEYVHRFGTTIDFNEIEEVKKDHEAAKCELNALIEQYMGEYGIKTKDEYSDYVEKYSDVFRDKKSDDYRNAVSEWGEEEYNRRAEIYDKLESMFWDHSLPLIFAVFKEQTITYYVEAYERLLEARKDYEEENDDWFFGDATEGERLVLENRLRKDEISVSTAFLGCLEENFRSYSSSWSLLIFICCAIAILPLLVKNKINHVTSLQYATKQGKRILWKQLSAALSVGLLICVILIIVFQLFYFKDGAVDFIHCPINLQVSDGLFWFDFTFLGYMICDWAKTIILVICEILALFWVSYYGSNYVTAIALSVPVIVVCNKICDEANNFLRVFYYPQFLYPLVLGAAVFVTVVISAILMRKAKKADYLG